MEKLGDFKISQNEDKIHDIEGALNTMKDKINEMIEELQLMGVGVKILTNFDRELLKLMNEFTKNKKVV